MRVPLTVLVQEDLQSAYKITSNVFQNSRKHFNPGIQKFAERMGATSKFQVLEG
jgi:hypothetical protein